MKRILFFCLLILLTVFAFAEFQLSPSLGYFYNIDTYDSDFKRSFIGTNDSVTVRYFFVQGFGLFFGIDTKVWIFGNNDDLYDKDAYIASEFSIGGKFDFNFGLALSFPINDKFRLQSDIGLSQTILGFEYISWEEEYSNGERDKIEIILTNMVSTGLYASVFGCIGARKVNFIFGLKVDFKFNRGEKGEMSIGDEKISISDTPDFWGLAISPFAGAVFRFR